MNVLILSAKTTKHCLDKKTRKKKPNQNIMPVFWELGNTDAWKYISFFNLYLGDSVLSVSIRKTSVMSSEQLVHF